MRPNRLLARAAPLRFGAVTVTQPFVQLALSIAFVALAACAARTSLPSYSSVPDFHLTDQTGASFDSAAHLTGKVWIADFIYTTCPGPCPRMSSQMHQVQTALSGIDNVRIVSFTVDPKNDTPPVLNEYASHFQAQPGRWFFLTGTEATLEHLARDVFMLNDIGGNLEHSTRFVLIDQNSRVRGYYETDDPASIPRLIADAKRLARERT